MKWVKEKRLYLCLCSVYCFIQESNDVEAVWAFSPRTIQIWNIMKNCLCKVHIENIRCYLWCSYLRGCFFFFITMTNVWKYEKNECCILGIADPPFVFSTEPQVSYLRTTVYSFATRHHRGRERDSKETSFFRSALIAHNVVCM